MAETSAVRFLVNPAAGRGSGKTHVDRIRVLASRHGAGLVVTRKGSDLWEQARKAPEDGVERRLGAAADATRPLAIQGLAGSECALGVIPLGTGNDFAGTLA